MSLVLFACAITVGCVTPNRHRGTNYILRGLSDTETALDITLEVAFSNALIVARQAYPDYRVKANRNQTLIAAIKDEGKHAITIEPIMVLASGQQSLKGVLYDIREISSRHLRTWMPPYLLQAFTVAYASNFPDTTTIEIEKPQLERKTTTLPDGIRITLEVPQPNQNQEGGLDVLDSTFEDALTIAYETSQAAFPSDKIETSPDRSFVQVLRDNSYRKFVFVIEPRIIRNPAIPEDYGILYRYSGRVVSEGYSGSSSVWQEQQRYEDEFWKRSVDRVTAKRFPNFRVSYDQGVPDRIASSIPTTYEAFKRYLEGRKGLLPYEGIWTEADGIYTLGIVHIANDPRFKYHAFVIESRRSSWQPGEIKAKFPDLKVNKIATGEYRIGSKALFGLSWKVRRDSLEGVSSVLGQNILLIKTYPTSGGSDFITGVGTAWAVTENGVFITAAHVVDGASKIYVGFKDKTPQEASVLILDQKLDLAVVKTKEEKTKYNPIPVLDTTVPNGTEITALGYPLAFEVGDDIKITGGLVSSQSGVQRDVTTYQISAPIQPGNSGGPIIDKYGNAVGVVVAQINDAAVGTDAELVNYAVKSPYVKPLLDVANIEAGKPREVNVLSTQDIAEMYKTSVLPIWTEN